MADYPAARCRRYLNSFLAFWELGFDVQSTAGMASPMVRGSSRETVKRVMVSGAVAWRLGGTLRLSFGEARKRQFSLELSRGVFRTWGNRLWGSYRFGLAVEAKTMRISTDFWIA